MKKNLLYSILVGAAVASLASCDVNSWNDKLDGFDGEQSIVDAQAIEYTLTDADYANLAANSDNIAKAGDALAKALKAVGTQHYFTNEISAKEYVPNFLSDPDFAYFTLDNGSSIKLTFKTAGDLPKEITDFAAAGEFTVDEAAYQAVWGDEEKYVEAFTPENPASKFIPGFLAEDFPEAKAGDMVVVNYKEAEQEPVFGSDEPEQPAVELSSTIGTADVGDNINVTGVITAICNRGYVLTDNSGSILVYYASGFDASAWQVGNVITLTDGAVSAYNLGLQITGNSSEEVIANISYTYPAATALDGAAFNALLNQSENALAKLVTFKAKVTISGNYYNFYVDGAETAVGSLYQGTADQKAMFADGNTYNITGYFLSISKSGGAPKFVNFVPVTTVAAAPAVKSSEYTIACKNVTALYAFDGSKWKASSSIAVLQSSDYEAMGQKYYNLTEPDFYLPIYLKGAYPYAKADDVKLVGYKLYSGGTTSLACDKYVFDGSAWNKDNGVVVETAQFVKTGGKWMYDPNVTITLPAGKGQELSTLYFQACTDWVWENIDKAKLGVSDKGKGYVTSYGNNEYYCGTSAYQGNVDLRPAKAKEQYPAGYEGMTDDQILDLMKTRFATEVMPGALAAIHPEAAPIEGLDVIYTITFGTYTGSNGTETIRYKVVAPGKFEFIDCTWDAEK